MRTPALPAGLTTRPLSRADAPEVTALMAAEELHDIGQVEIEEADLVGDWQRPGFVLEESAIAVLDGSRMVAYAELGPHGRCDTAVHPDHRGRGTGTWLAAWLCARARERGETEIGMPVPQGSDADRLLDALGFHVRWTSWILELPPDREVPARPLPPGYLIRQAAPGEHTAAHATLEDAFLEWSVREREPFEEFEATVLRRPGFEPWNLRVAVDPGGTVVGVAVIVLGAPDASSASSASSAGPASYVTRLAVRGDQRRRGLAQALMVDAFAMARAHGAVTSGLSTDSRTGALTLYERVGMQVTSTWVNRAIAVAAPLG